LTKSNYEEEMRKQIKITRKINAIKLRKNLIKNNTKNKQSLVTKGCVQNIVRI